MHFTCVPIVHFSLRQIAHNVHLTEETNDAVKDFPEFDAIENTVCDHLNSCLKEIRDFIGERVLPFVV